MEKVLGGVRWNGIHKGNEKESDWEGWYSVGTDNREYQEEWHNVWRGSFSTGCGGWGIYAVGRNNRVGERARIEWFSVDGKRE
jgi:hypothetical protein